MQNKTNLYHAVIALSKSFRLRADIQPQEITPKEYLISIIAGEEATPVNSIRLLMNVELDLSLIMKAFASHLTSKTKHYKSIYETEALEMLFNETCFLKTIEQLKEFNGDKTDYDFLGNLIFKSRGAVLGKRFGIV